MIRALEERDGPAILAFVQDLPQDETTFFKDEQIASTRIADWARHSGSRRLVATEDDGAAILGYVAIIPRTGLSGHVGEISLVVAKRARGRGVGRSLARAAMVSGFGEMGLTKLVVEIVADQEGTARMFRNLGFSAEALLRDHLRDRDGRMRDLMMFCHLAEDGWSEMETLGIGDALRDGGE